MRISRLLTASLVVASVAAIAANPGCSSSNANDAFDSGNGNDGRVSPDVGTRDAGKDGPGHLMGGHDAAFEAAHLKDVGVFNDAKLKIDATGCVADAAGPGPVQHICVIYPAGGDDENECDGHHDIAGFPPNGTGGNGFDDNCNGLVDEGCSCLNVGQTKPCYLVPASQTVNGLPVGWCAENSKGTVNCAQQGEGGPTWSGQCRGAQPPYSDDFCAPGDFNCDGKEENSTAQNCSCMTGPIQCPTTPLVTVPYPPINPLPLKINAADWFTNPSQVSSATNWSWSITGGDCDNILPFPTFSIYPTADGSSDPPSAETYPTNLCPNGPCPAGMPGQQHGVTATSPTVSSFIYPAFSLSGDYIATASWTLDGMPYACTVKVQVRAPGIRAEACWDTVAADDDLDLHMSRIDNFPQCSTTHDWSDSVCMQGEDCFYDNCLSGQNAGGANWNYPDSPASVCDGWGSEAGMVSSCTNPRLDRDANGLSGACDPTVKNPNNTGMGFLSSGPYCGPENINVDNPGNNERFAVGVRFYGRDGTATTNARTHADVYCNGARVLAAGFDPIAGQNYPQLITPGADSTGDMWKVGVVTTQILAGVLNCTVDTTSSANPHVAASYDTDGSSAYCVDNFTLDGATSQELLTSSGLEPANGAALCYH